MITRYSREEISNIWTQQSKFSYYLKVELAVVEAYNKMGVVSDVALEHIKKTAKFDLKRIDEIEKVVQHDVIAFLTSVNENVGEKYSGLIHMGLTSSDVIDTAFALQITDSTKIILDDLDKVILSLKNFKCACTGSRENTIPCSLHSIIFFERTMFIILLSV